VRGAVDYAGLRRFDDAAVLSLASRVEVHADPACTRYETRLQVRLCGGEALSAKDSAGE